MKTDWIPETVFIIVAGLIFSQIVSCAREAPGIQPEVVAARSAEDLAMIQKGYHRNGWGNWVKDK